MLRQPAEAPPPADPLHQVDGIVTFRRVWSDAKNGASGRSFRRWASRVSGRSDRRLLVALSDATDAIATRCDLLTARLAAQESMMADVVAAFGEEITRLRAVVLQLQREVTSERDTES